MKEKNAPTKRCLGSLSDVVLNSIPEVDASDEGTDDDMLDLADSTESEAGDDGYLDNLNGKIIADDEGMPTHRLICSNGTVRSSYKCGSCGSRQTCCSKTFVPCFDDAFDEDVIHLLHPGNAGCGGAFELLQMPLRVDSPGRKPIKSGSENHNNR